MSAIVPAYHGELAQSMNAKRQKAAKKQSDQALIDAFRTVSMSTPFSYPRLTGSSPIPVVDSNFEKIKSAPLSKGMSRVWMFLSGLDQGFSPLQVAERIKLVEKQNLPTPPEKK
jgi:hypothetical protein